MEPSSAEQRGCPKFVQRLSEVMRTPGNSESRLRARRSFGFVSAQRARSPVRNAASRSVNLARRALSKVGAERSLHSRGRRTGSLFGCRGTLRVVWCAWTGGVVVANGIGPQVFSN